MTCSEFKTQYQIRLNPQQEAAVRQVAIWGWSCST